MPQESRSVAPANLATAFVESLSRRVENSRPARSRSTQRPNQTLRRRPYFACAPFSFGERRTGQWVLRKAGRAFHGSRRAVGRTPASIARSRCASSLVVFAGSSDSGSAMDAASAL
jgi:hypothetical protein